VLIDDRRVSRTHLCCVTCLMGNGHVYTGNVLGVSLVLIDDRRVSRTHWCCVTYLIRVAYTHKLLHHHLIHIETYPLIL
jgi:hypothetical protein